jgi:NTP pyrophosphatase (non-canonical NTP hydrolase)
MTEKDLETICQHYGIRKQIKKLSEEVFELQEAVIEQEQELFIKDKTDHVAEELADVMVLWEQIRLHYDVPVQVVRGIMMEKVERQLERIDGETITLKEIKS